MKKIIICALAALSVSAVLTSCGNYRCSVCYDKCSDSNSYKDGEYIQPMELSELFFAE